MKYLVFSLALLVSMNQALAEQSFCSIAGVEVSSSLIDKFKGKFIAEKDAYYSRLVSSNSISQKEKAQALKRYSNPSVRVCSNPQNTLQKVVYVEYEKNWWGNLYFAILENDEILKWNAINTYGAVTEYVRWSEGGFFYEDSTHSGAKTQNTCHVERGSIRCQKLRK